MNFEEKKIDGKVIYDGKILRLEVDDVALCDGTRSVRECVRHCGGAAVLLVEDGKVLLVRQFRYLYEKEIYEIPAGKIDTGETPVSAATRELEEETGYAAELTHAFNLYPSPGYTDEVIYVYFAENAKKRARHPDAGEFLSSEFVPLEKVVKMIESGEICDAKTVSAVYRYLSLK